MPLLWPYICTKNYPQLPYGRVLSHRTGNSFIGSDSVLSISTEMPRLTKEQKARAIALRKAGYTYREIGKILEAPYTTLIPTLRGVPRGHKAVVEEKVTEQRMALAQDFRDLTDQMEEMEGNMASKDQLRSMDKTLAEISKAQKEGKEKPEKSLRPVEPVLEQGAPADIQAMKLVEMNNLLNDRCTSADDEIRAYNFVFGPLSEARKQLVELVIRRKWELKSRTGMLNPVLQLIYWEMKFDRLESEMDRKFDTVFAGLMIIMRAFDKLPLRTS